GFHLSARTLVIDADPAALTPALAAIRAAGFDPQPLADSATPDTAASSRRELQRLGVALACAAGAEALAWFGGDALAWRLAGSALALLAIVLSGFGVYRKGLAALRDRRLNINALMTVAVTGAFVIGQWAEAAMVMALYAIAEAIEARAVDRARNAIGSLMQLAPDHAQLRQADGSWRSMLATEVAVGAIVRVRPGERIPLDGTLATGSTSVDQASVTGESLPIDKIEGDALFAGTINLTGTVELRVTAPASQSTLARIIHAVEQAQGSRAPTQRFVDRFAAVYTPAVFALALGVAIAGPWLAGWSAHDAIYKALVLLVIACPCALVISTPVAIVSGLAAGARRGILIKGGVYLEQARRLKAVAFDKTGTLTAGRPRLMHWAPLAPDAGP
ncbi:MAG TPA: HAD-IC family P-type ATPase, partial [Burkholderiaceae bacterium]|nr:HAD-IC family P-type ATPase [Burkholderiaceae bacterium]